MDVIFNGSVKNDNGSVFIAAGRGSVLFAVHAVSTSVKGKHYVPRTCKRVAWFSSFLMNGFFVFVLFFMKQVNPHLSPRYLPSLKARTY